MRGLRETVPRRRLKSLLVLSILAFSAAVAALSLSLSHGAAAESLGGWTSTTAYGGGALDRSSCAYYAGYIYCVGGYDGSNAVSTVEYAPVSTSGVGSWTSTTAYKGGTVQDESCAAYAGYIYCVGGIVAGSNSSAVYYAPVSSSGVGTWTSTTAYAPGSVTGTSCFISSGDLFCVGGVVGTSLSSTVEYAPVSSSGVGTWTSTTAYGAGTVTAESCATSGGYVYCVGGLVGGGSGSISSAVYYASVSSSGVGTWTSTTAYGGGTVRTESCSTSSGYIYCVGGYDGTSVVSTVEYAQVSSSGVGSWTSTTAYGGGAIEDQSCAAAYGYLYCVAGFTGAAVTSAVYYDQLSIPSVSQTKECAVTTAATSGTCAFASFVPVGDIVGVGVVTSSSADTVSTVTDSGSNTYAKAVSEASQSASDVELWKSCVTTAGTLTVTVTVSASTTFDIILYDVSNSYCRTMLSSTGTSSGSTSASVASYSPPVNSIVIGVMGSACTSTCTVTAGSGYTLDNNAAVGSTQASSESKLEAASSETTPFSMSTSSAWNEVSMQVPPTEFQDTFKASYPDGSPSVGAPVHCLQNGVLATLGDLTTAGVSGYCDYGSVAYAQAFAPGGSSTQQYSAVPLTYGLVGYWPLQEGTGTSAFDLSHNNDTGTLVNSPTWSSTGGPFTGTGYLGVTGNQGMAAPIQTIYTGFTIAAWMKISSAPTSSCDEFLVGNNTGTVGRIGRIFWCSNQQLSFDNGGTTTVGPARDNSFPTGSFVPVIGVVTSSSITLYVNGIKIQSVSGTTVLSAPTGKLWINDGWQGVSPNNVIDIAFVSVYSYAFTSSQVSEWGAQTSLQALENKITSPSNTYTFDYYHQYAEAPYYTAISGSPSGDALNYYYSSLGQSLTDTMGTSAATIWADASTATVGDHYVSSGERYSSNANVTLSAANTSGPDVSIYHQYAATSSYSGTVATGGAPSLACQRYGSPSSDALTTTASVKWVDSGCAFTVTKPSADFPGGGVRYETDYANGTISAATTIDPAFYQQFYVTPGSGISKLTGTEFGSPMTYTAPGWLDSGTSVTSDGTASCAFTVSAPSWDYQFGGSALQAWLNTTGSSFGDYTRSSPPYVTFDASHVSATVCVPSSSGLSVTGVTDDGSSVAYSWTPPLVTFSGDSAFEVNLLGSGSSSPSPGSSGSSVQSTVTTVVISTTNAAPSAPIPGSEFALVILALGAFGAVLLVYRSRGQIEGDGHDLEAAVKRATSPVAPRLKVPTLDNRKKRKRRQA